MNTKKEMKLKNNKSILIIILASLTLILGLIAINKKDEEIIIKNNNNDKILNEYKKNINDIKNNLDYISSSNPENTIKWFKFKYENLNETELGIINMLIFDIRMFYAYAAKDGEYYQYENYLDKFDNIDKISKKDFINKIEGYNAKNKDYLGSFTKYNDFFLSENSTEFYKLKFLIDPLVLLYKTTKDKNINDYEELLMNEYTKSVYLSNLSLYLRNYYEGLIKSDKE